MKHDILKPILDLTIQESRRDNLLSCSCQEYFENMRKDNIKDLVRFCMTAHEAEIQQLAKSSLGGQRFELFIRRWEMNNEPLPSESESKSEVHNGRGWSSHDRALDLAEEDYFNADDDEEELLSTISQQWLRGSGSTSPLSANNTGMKRKRCIGMGTQTKCRPPLRTPRLSALVDYEEDDEEYPSSDQAVSSIQAIPKSIPDPGPQPSPTPSINITTPTPTPSLSPGPLQKYDDHLSEALARPRIRLEAPASIKLMRPSEKRRRTDDDDDDGLLERLAKSSKKPDPNNQKEAFTIRSKNGDDPPVAKKIKVKFGAVGLAVATSPSIATMPATSVDSAAPSSEASRKEGEIG
jgi:protein phosphatase-4 regulatory subunit 3